jgi:hypothetical protein
MSEKCIAKLKTVAEARQACPLVEMAIKQKVQGKVQGVGMHTTFTGQGAAQ